MTSETPNNSFKPNLLRYTKAMAEKACHGFGYTTQVGLTQALGLKGTITYVGNKTRRWLSVRRRSVWSNLRTSTERNLPLPHLLPGQCGPCCRRGHFPRQN